MTETLRGTVERVTFHNPENGFAVLRVKVPRKRGEVTVVGSVTAVTAGEDLEASGRWITNPEHGPQFQADQIQTTHPSSAAGIQRYLASGAVRSIGPRLAEKMVGIYKAQTLKVIDESPGMLLHIRGIGRQRLEKICDSWQQQKQIRRIMLFLHELGVGSRGRAARIYRTYGSEAIAAIKQNPYRLADDVRGIGFQTADELAAKLGIDPHSPVRAQAAVRYALEQLGREGHCGYPEPEVLARTGQLVDMPAEILVTAVATEIAAGTVIREEVDGQPWLYLRALHRAESGLAQQLHRLTRQGSHPLPAIDVDVALKWVQDRLDIELAPAQQQAVRVACTQRVVVITGGPGVGKTTLIRSILEIFLAKQQRCVLTAPTGRAAKRLAETTGRQAQTVHRLLEFNPAIGDFQRNQSQPLTGNLFVLDEASMVDVFLAFQFLRAVPSNACVVLVGDVDQLPSVGPGSVLHDVIAADVVPVVRLTEVFRQAAQSRIVTSAYAINRGRLPDLSQPEVLGDFYFIELDDPDAIQDTIIRLVKDRIPARFGLDPLADIQVLAPMKRSKLGTYHLNTALQEALNPAENQPAVERAGWTYRLGDRVIQTVNNYSRDVFNGDLGFVSEVNRVDQELSVVFDGRTVVYEFSDLEELALAYVLSIHKSQGSEYPCIIVPLHTQHFIMLQRNLLYTAVTRGKRLVVLVGSKRALRLSVSRQDTRRRCSALRNRLVEAFH